MVNETSVKAQIEDDRSDPKCPRHNARASIAPLRPAKHFRLHLDIVTGSTNNRNDVSTSRPNCGRSRYIRSLTVTHRTTLITLVHVARHAPQASSRTTAPLPPHHAFYQHSFSSCITTLTLSMLLINHPQASASIL
ncbi:hypothetical protein BDW22DRAFT_1363772 [Trametopsis cervina]|nr:hypothetical protein BDW22DRAFT_1363772 [Trametopsis cervina]